MTTETALKAHNLVCEIDRLECFVNNLKRATSISVEIFATVDYEHLSSDERSYSIYQKDSDTIDAIINIMEAKLNKLKQELESM